MYWLLMRKAGSWVTRLSLKASFVFDVTYTDKI